MFCESIAALFLMGFISPGQSTVTSAPTANTTTVTTSATPNQALNSVLSSTMTSVVSPPQTSAIVQSAQTSTSKPPANTTTPRATSPSSPSSTFSTPSMTPQAKPSCVLVSFIAERAWNASLSDSLSVLHNKTSEEISQAVKHFFNESSKYEDVEVSGHEYSEKEGVTLVKMNLCLVVKTSDGAFIAAVFIDKVKTGYLFEGFEIRKDSAEFKPLGVEFKDWKAKEGECTKCEGAAGEFTIEGKCVPQGSSCKGLKNTKITKDCVAYCDDSSAGTYTVSFLILAIGIFFSFSFQ